MNNGNNKIMKFLDIRSYFLNAYLVVAVPVTMLYVIILLYIVILPKYSWTTLTLGDAALLIALAYYLLYIFYLYKVVDNYLISRVLRKTEAVNVRGIRVILSEGALNAFVPTLLSIGPGGERIVVATRELRDKLSPEEFEAVVCHEEGHIVNMHTNTLYYLIPYFVILLVFFLRLVII